MGSAVVLGAVDWSQLIIVLVVASFNVVAHPIELVVQAKKGTDAMNPQPNRPQRPNPDLSDEVEAFLKSVQQRQGKAPQGPRRPPRRQSAQRGGPVRNEPVTAEVVEAQIVPVPTLVGREDSFGRGASLSGDAVAAEAEMLGRQTQSLGAQINQTDERIAEQIHAKFDHQLGQFDSGPAASDDATQATSQADAESTDLAADLRQMLSDPRDIRRIIVASEILSPPVDRW